MIKPFRDLEDKLYTYKLNKPYPRKGFEASGKRIEELSGNENKQEEPLIKKVVDKKSSKSKQSNFPKHIGGGWYELSNGEKIQGKDDALQAEKEL